MLRLFNDWVLVRLDPPTPMSSVIASVKDSSIRTGEVLQVGPGLWKGQSRIPVPLVTGDRVAFSQGHLKHGQGRALLSFLEGMEEGTALIRAPDVLFAFTGNVRVTT